MLLSTRMASLYEHHTTLSRLPEIHNMQGEVSYLKMIASDLVEASLRSVKVHQTLILATVPGEGDAVWLCGTVPSTDGNQAGTGGCILQSQLVSAEQKRRRIKDTEGTSIPQNQCPEGLGISCLNCHVEDNNYCAGVQVNQRRQQISHCLDVDREAAHTRRMPIAKIAIATLSV